MPALERYLQEVMNNEQQHNHRHQLQQLSTDDIVADVYSNSDAADDDSYYRKLDTRHNDGRYIACSLIKFRVRAESWFHTRI